MARVYGLLKLAGTIRWVNKSLLMKLSLFTHAIVYSQTRYKRQAPVPVFDSTSNVPGVSILRPLKGIDLDLADNLRSSFEQRYPKYEIIFSVADSNDPAIDIVEQLQKEYPDVDCRLIIGKSTTGDLS